MEFQELTDDTQRLAWLQDNLSARQLEVLTLSCEGLTKAEIARRLKISPPAVTKHWQRLEELLGDPAACCHLFATTPEDEQPLIPWLVHVPSQSLWKEPPPLVPDHRPRWWIPALIAGALLLLILGRLSSAFIGQSSPPTPELAAAPLDTATPWVIHEAQEVTRIVVQTPTLNAADNATAVAAAAAATAYASFTPYEVRAPTSTPAPPTATPAPTLTPRPQPTAMPKPQPGDLLYQADWSEGPDKWPVSGQWKWSSGNLLADGTQTNFVAAPYQVPLADYAVEARIRALGSLGSYTHFGLVARANFRNNNAGYVAGFKCHCPEVMAIGQGVDSTTSYYTIAEHPFDPGKSPHTYRFEVKGYDLTIFIDEGLVATGQDPTFLSGPVAGIYADDMQIEVSSFKITAL